MLTVRVEQSLRIDRAAPRLVDANDLRAWLTAASEEVSLDTDAGDKPGKAQQPREKIQQQVQTIAEQIKRDPDSFVQQLKAKRADLAGLPWRLGAECQLSPAAASALQELSLATRVALAHAR